MMKRDATVLRPLLVLTSGILVIATPAVKAQQATVPVHMVVMVEPLSEGDKTVRPLSKEDVKVTQGKNKLQVTDWIPAREDRAGLQLFILIDDTSDKILGSNLGDVKEFIKAQPPTTWVGVGYMRNATVNIVQNFTTDHDQAANAVRLPLGTLSTQDSPYLSLIALLQGWPENKLRRTVLMIGDGIDRLRGLSTPSGGIQGPDLQTYTRGARSGRAAAAGPPPTRSYQTMPMMSPDVDRASQMAQRYGVFVHSIYTPGVGHVGRNYWELTNGQNAMSKLADETGSESFFLGLQNPVSLRPYLDRLKVIMDNQYFLVFQAVPGKKDSLQRIKTRTEVPNVEIVSADNVWVPATARAPASSADSGR
jgi:hypothetical protein